MPQLYKSAKIKTLASYEGVLTEDEIIDLITDAAERKLAKEREVNYWNNINKPVIQKIPTSDEFLQTVLDNACKHIPRFILNPIEDTIYQLLSFYFTNDKRFEERSNFSLNKGLLIFGNIGCGKTTILNLFRNNPKQGYGMVGCKNIAHLYAQEGSKVIDKYSGMLSGSTIYGQKEAGICFDDLGTESSTKHFGTESNVMSDILLNRYDRNDNTTHLTTNLTAEQIKEFYGDRVASRMKEMFNLIKFPKEILDKRR